MNIEKIKKDLKKQFILPYKEEFINKFKINKDWFSENINNFISSINPEIGIINTNVIISYKLKNTFKGYEQFSYRLETSGRGAAILPIEYIKNKEYFYLIPQYRFQASIDIQKYYFGKISNLISNNKLENIIDDISNLIEELLKNTGRISFEVPRGFSKINELSENTAIRELKEEMGFIPISIEKMSEDCSNTSWEGYTIDSYLAIVSKNKRELRDIDEKESIGKPQKFSFLELKDLIKKELLYCSISKSLIASYLIMKK